MEERFTRKNAREARQSLNTDHRDQLRCSAQTLPPSQSHSVPSVPSSTALTLPIQLCSCSNQCGGAEGCLHPLEATSKESLRTRWAQGLCVAGVCGPAGPCGSSAFPAVPGIRLSPQGMEGDNHHPYSQKKPHAKAMDDFRPMAITSILCKCIGRWSLSSLAPWWTRAGTRYS